MEEGTATYSIPAIYKGDTIEVQGFLMTQSIPETCTRGFFLNTDDGDGELHSVITEEKNIDFDGNWHEYNLKIPLHRYAREIVFGTFIYGEGRAWVDDLQLLVDGKPLKKASKKELIPYPALLDSSFNSASGITIDSLNAGRINDLTLLGKIWGFVKYYHPQVAQGNVNMDAELFRILPRIIDSRDSRQRDRILVEWLNSLGKIPEYPSLQIEPEGDHKLLPDLKWIKDEGMSKELRSKLEHILENRNQGPNYYVSLNPGIGNPVFKHENRYPELSFPDEGFRILALYRYWNMVQYFFPYKDLIGEDWNDILPEYLPKFLNAEDALEYRLVSLHLIGRIHDTHANIWGVDSILENYKGRYYAPVQLRFIEGQPVVSGYYNEGLGRWSGLKSGDIIISVDGKAVEEIIHERLEYYPASNHPTKLRDIAKDLLRGSSASVRVQFIRDGQARQSTFSRYPANQIDLSHGLKLNQPDSCYRLINDSVGYLFLGNVKNDMLEDIFNHFKDTRGIIIDIRNYPSEFVVFTLGKYLMPDPVEFVKFTNPDISYPGLFKWIDPPAVGETNRDYYKGKVVILVNEITQSQAEYTTMALQAAPSSIVLGNTTAGADGNVSRIFLPGNIFTMISGIGVYYPDGTETQRTGIIPDITLHPSIQGVTEGRDEILEKAIEMIFMDSLEPSIK